MQHVYKSFLHCILLSGLVLALAACGSSRSDDAPSQVVDSSDFGTDENGIAFIGADRCIGCHASSVIEGEEVPLYLESRHVLHSTAVRATFPANCLACHDPVGDGVTLEPFLESSQVPADGLAAVTCEACHGAGGEHFGVGPLPHSTPDFNQCGRCHTTLPPGPSGHADAAANGIFENYVTGSHRATLQGAAIALCSRCHSDEGFRSFIENTRGLDQGQLTTALTGVPAPVAPTTVQCRTCHDPHSGGLRATDSIDGENGIAFSQQFNLCTSCHQVFLLASFDPDAQSFTYELDRTRTPFHGTAGAPSADSGNLVIWDTHFPSPTDGIAGYGINAAGVQACTSCHDPHRANKFGTLVVPQ